LKASKSLVAIVCSICTDLHHLHAKSVIAQDPLPLNN
jgi:hypothetical protein